MPDIGHDWSSPACERFDRTRCILLSLGHSAWRSPRQLTTEMSCLLLILSAGPDALCGVNLTFPVARYGVGLSFREVFGIEFCDTPQLAAGSFILTPRQSQPPGNKPSHPLRNV